MREAQAWLVDRYENAYLATPSYEGGHWAVPASPEVIEAMSTNFANPNTYPVDSRGIAYTLGFFSAKHLGAGPRYLMTFKDKTATASTALIPIGLTCRLQHRSRNTGQRRSTTAPRMPLSGTCKGRAPPPRPRDFKRTRTTRLMFISARKHQLAKSSN
jgi:hypothetical protein